MRRHRVHIDITIHQEYIMLADNPEHAKDLARQRAQRACDHSAHVEYEVMEVEAIDGEQS